MKRIAPLLKRTLITASKLFLAVGILYWLYRKGVLDFKLLSMLLRPELLLGFTLALASTFFFVSWRWQILLKTHKIYLSLWEAYKLNIIGLFFNHVMPGGVGGDVVKAYYIVKENPKNRMGAGITVLLDRVFGLYAMTVLAIVALCINYSQVERSNQLLLILKSCFIFFVVFNLALLLALSSRFSSLGWKNWFLHFSLGRKLVSAYDAVHSYSQNLISLVSAVFLSLIAQSISVMIIWRLGVALSFDDVSLSTYLSVVPLGFMVTAVPISPAGVGVGQMAFFFLFNLFLGHESQVGPSVITAFQIFNFLLGLLGILFFIQRKSSLHDIEVAADSDSEVTDKGSIHARP